MSEDKNLERLQFQLHDLMKIKDKAWQSMVQFKDAEMSVLDRALYALADAAERVLYLIFYLQSQEEHSKLLTFFNKHEELISAGSTADNALRLLKEAYEKE